MKKAIFPKISENNVTSEDLFNNRRLVMKTLGIASIGLMSPSILESNELKSIKNTKYTQQELTPLSKITSYNNFYEFGYDKADPAKLSKNFKTNPWSVIIDGEVESPITLSIDDIAKKLVVEERIYAMRCVEAWSMNIPWNGVELGKLIALAKPKSSAQFVAFESVLRPEEMPGQKRGLLGGGIQYPYTEGLRLDEAMHPLTLMALGIYGKALLPQNGAPIRLVVPWKYGFKSIKSIVRITLTKTEPPATWNLSQPREYGFYANVNPEVSHPRWSQAEERFIGDSLLNLKKKKTLPFNGYTEVAHLYRNMDLKVKI